MRPESGDLALLWDMREHASKLVELLAGMDEADFLQDENVRLITERRIEIIGEAANHVSPQLRAKHPEVPWRQITAQRNVIIHAYGDIIPERLWQSGTEDARILVPLLDAIIKSLSEDSDQTRT